jgi:predicted ester cyclase
MSNQENVASYRRLIEEAFGGAQVALVDELLALDFVEHQRGPTPGPEGVKEKIRTLHSWFADFDMKVMDVLGHGDKVWGLNRARGVNTGRIMGRESTGRPMEIDVIDIVRFADGKIIEHWGVPDQLGMMQQLGLVPGPPEPRSA